jgi:NAD-dependent dihydropyrimidine dehydrogenase PreA subunit
VSAEPSAESGSPVSFEPDLCIGCNVCVDVCQVDILLPNPVEGLPPIVVFPGECWYDGSCVSACPVPGAITLNRMAKDRVRVRRRTTGEDFFV